MVLAEAPAMAAKLQTLARRRVFIGRVFLRYMTRNEKISFLGTTYASIMPSAKVRAFLRSPVAMRRCL
jgi:hypothetical protein